MGVGPTSDMAVPLAKVGSLCDTQERTDVQGNGLHVTGTNSVWEYTPLHGTQMIPVWKTEAAGYLSRASGRKGRGNP